MRIRLIIFIIAVIFVILGGIWYVVAPGSVREFCINHPQFDLRRRTINASDTRIRLSGVAMILMGLAMLFGVLAVLGII